MFTDFKNFTQATEKLSAEDLVSEINRCYSEFDKIISRHNIEKIKTMGDAYMCAGGLPVNNDTHAQDVVMAGLEMQRFIAAHMEQRRKEGLPYFELRVGIHTGPVIAGIVGIKKFAYDIWGDTVNTASRMESSGEPGRVNISGATHELVKNRFACEHVERSRPRTKGLSICTLSVILYDDFLQSRFYHDFCNKIISHENDCRCPDAADIGKRGCRFTGRQKGTPRIAGH
jgi:class 3 adenylate cyclase